MKYVSQISPWFSTIKIKIAQVLPVSLSLSLAPSPTLAPTACCSTKVIISECKVQKSPAQQQHQ